VVRVGVIGAGEWGRNHVRVYRELEDADLIAVSDLDDKNVKAIDKVYKVRASPDYRTLLKDGSIEAVSICTPASTHFALIKEALECEKDVITEKPMTLRSDEARELVDLAEERGLILMVGHINRFNPAVRHAKEMIARKDFGSLYFLQTSRIGPRAPRPDCGVTFDFAIHDIDAFCFLLDQPYPSEVMAAMGAFLGREYDDVAFITMRFHPNVVAHAHASWLSPRKIRDLLIVGSQRSAYGDFLTQELEVFNTGVVPEYDSFGTFKLITVEGETRKPWIPKEEPLKNELRHFLQCVRTRQRPISDGEVGLRSVELIEKVYESAKAGKAVRCI